METRAKGKRPQAHKKITYEQETWFCLRFGKFWIHVSVLCNIILNVFTFLIHAYYFSINDRVVCYLKKNCICFSVLCVIILHVFLNILFMLIIFRSMTAIHLAGFWSHSGSQDTFSLLLCTTFDNRDKQISLEKLTPATYLKRRGLHGKRYNFQILVNKCLREYCSAGYHSDVWYMNSEVCSLRGYVIYKEYNYI